MKKEDVNEICTCLLLLLDDVDYISYPGCLTEMVGQAIPKEILERCHKAKTLIMNDYHKAKKLILDDYRREKKD